MKNRIWNINIHFVLAIFHCGWKMKSPVYVFILFRYLVKPSEMPFFNRRRKIKKRKMDIHNFRNFSQNSEVLRAIKCADDRRTTWLMTSSLRVRCHSVRQVCGLQLPLTSTSKVQLSCRCCVLSITAAFWHSVFDCILNTTDRPVPTQVSCVFIIIIRNVLLCDNVDKTRSASAATAAPTQRLF